MALLPPVEPVTGSRLEANVPLRGGGTQPPGREAGPRPDRCRLQACSAADVEPPDLALVAGGVPEVAVRADRDRVRRALGRHRAAKRAAEAYRRDRAGRVLG